MDEQDYSDMSDSEEEKEIDTVHVGPFTYKLYEGNRAILSLAVKSESNVTIPATIDHDGEKYTVMGIGERALRESKISHLEFDEECKITTLGKDSLYCHSLEEVTLPPLLDKLERGWCNFTLKLNTIVLPSSNTNFQIYNNALYSRNLDILYFVPRNSRAFEVIQQTKIISSYCFEQCRRLKEVTFQEESCLVRIDPWAFSHCGLRSIQFPDSLVTISYDAFFQSRKLSQIEFGDDSNLKEILISAFKNTNLTKIVLPKSLKKVAIAAFQGNKNLSKVTFLSKDTMKVWRDAFKDCSPEFEYVKFEQAVINGDGLKGKKEVTEHEI